VNRPRNPAVGAWRELHSALLDLTTPTVCASDAESFTDPAPEYVAYLATLCTGCPVFALCNTFANVNRERDGGIWAGKHRQPRRGRPAAEPKERTAACST